MFDVLVPFVFFSLWLGIIVYAIFLGTRLVNAVEQIARAMTERLPDSPHPDTNRGARAHFG